MTPVRLAWVWLIVACIGGVAVAADEAPRRLDLKIAPNGWGGSSLNDVEVVLRSAGDELVKHYRRHAIESINVQGKGGPIVLFRRADDGAVIMKLNTGQNLWAQMSFQFAHELCHVLCRYDEDIHGHDWLEETICEVASLYVLRRMGEKWKTDAPYPNWKGYAKALTGYAQTRIDERPLPEGTTLAQWYAEHAKVLRKNPTARDLNRVAAGVLLPMFEKSPESWEAIRWFNAGAPGRVQTLGEFLGDWRAHAPKRHAAFIEQIGDAFGVELVEP